MTPAGGPAGATEIEQALLDHAAAPGRAELVLERDPAWTPDAARARRVPRARARRARAARRRPRARRARPRAAGPDDATRASTPPTSPRGPRSPPTRCATRARGWRRRSPAAAGAARRARPGGQARRHGAAGAPRCARELDRRAAAVAAADRRPRARRRRARRRLPPAAARDAAAGGELVASLAASTELQGGDPLAAVTWLQRAAHVRDGASRLETALLYAEATGSPQPLRLRVAQLPRRAGDRWAGLPATRAAADHERPAVARRAVGRGARRRRAARRARRRRVDRGHPGPRRSSPA